MSKRLWITWEIQRRNRSLSRQVKAKLYEVIGAGNRLKRYPFQIIRSLKILHNEKPDILFVQNPSIVLAFLSVVTRKLFGVKKLIVDAHNAGIFPLEGRSRILNSITNLIIRRSDAVIVTNKYLADYVKQLGGHAFIIPDPLPVFGDADELPEREVDVMKATFICTWSDDEPYKELISAAGRLAGDIEISITGKHNDRINVTDLPDNIFLTGFLDDSDYVNLLHRSDFMIVLTTRDNCLNCGAYESVSLQKPIILSDTEALRSYFHSGVIYTRNDSLSIELAIKKMIENYAQMSGDIKGLKSKINKNWSSYQRPLEDYFTSST